MSKSKDGGVAEATLEYLKSQNRPYSAVDVFNNLHKQYGKTQLQKALDELVQQGKVREKLYGKQKVYVVNQDAFPAANEEELKAMDSKILEFDQKLKSSTDSLRVLETEYNALNNSLTTADLKNQLSECLAEIEQLTVKIKDLKSNKNPISPAEKERVYKEHERCNKEWKKRKRMAMDVVNAIMEGYPKTKKALLEEMDVETDEDVGVSITT